MAQITRSTKIAGGTTLQSNTLARAVDVETDILTLFTAHNNADTGTTKWQVGSFENALSTVLIANNSTGTNTIFQAQDNGTAVLTVADNGATSLTCVGGSTETLTVSNSTSTGAIARLNDNATTVLLVADGGTVTFSPGGTNKVVASSTGLTLSNSATIAMGAAKVTGLANGSTSTDAAAFGQIGGTLGTNAAGYIKGTVVQAVQVTQTNSTTSSGTTYTTTGTAASITPLATTHKIRISVTGALDNNTDSSTAKVSIFRDASDLDATANGFSHVIGAVGAAMSVPCAMTYLDSPASTSAITYAVKIKSSTAAQTIWNALSGSAVILLEEIAF